MGALLAELVIAGHASMVHFGFSFFLGHAWDPLRGAYGALPFLFGTAVSAIIGLVIATVLGLGTALLLTQYATLRIIRMIGFLVNLLAAVPSVVYGLWGIFIVVPWLRVTLEPALYRVFGDIPLFAGARDGVGMLAAGLVLGIMTLPTIAAVVRDVFGAVPNTLRDGALALGATNQEMIRMAVLPFARAGIFGAVMLGLVRALGETMAVLMVIGNQPSITGSLFAPAYTLSSAIASEFAEAASPLYLSALYELGFILLMLTILIYTLARLLVWRVRWRGGLPL